MLDSPCPEEPFRPCLQAMGLQAMGLRAMGLRAMGNSKIPIEN